MKTHYTYVIHNIISGRYYIGVRSCLGDPQDDTYMGSSKYLTAEMDEFPEGWIKFIHKTYTTREEANIDEGMMTDGHLANDLCINKSRGGKCWKKMTPEINEKRRKTCSTPEFKKRFGEAIRRGMAKPGVKEKRSKIIKEILALPEVKEKLSNSLKAAFAKPEVKERHRAASVVAFNKPELKAHRSAVQTERCKDPKTLANMFAKNKERNADPVEMAKLGAATSKGRSTPKSKMNHAMATAIRYGYPFSYIESNG